MITNAGVGCMTESDPAIAAEMLAEARDVTARSGDGYRHARATAWLRIASTTGDPRAALQTIREVVEYARSTGQHVVPHYVGPVAVSAGVASGSQVQP